LKGNIFKGFCYLGFYQSRYFGEKTVTYTRFEKARIIGARALQLSMGAPSILAEIPKDMIDPVEIAMLEYDEGAIPITVKRKEIKA
jgi:DNA-directed RNA polymerase subunit K